MLSPIVRSCVGKSRPHHVLVNKILILEKLPTPTMSKGRSYQTFMSVLNHSSSNRVLDIQRKNLLLSCSFQPFEVVRNVQSTPFNTIIMFVPQQEAWIVERMGKFNRILQPGLNFLIPIIDRIKYVQSLKELAIDIPKQSAITLDNVTLNIDGVLYLRVMDPYKASYGVEDPEFAITQLAQTTMRSELGQISLDSVFRERESLNFGIVEAINKASNAWGIDCLRYEIRDIRLPQRVNEAMQMQVEAERKKRAAILESEGIREADINVAEGKKAAKILSSEAEKQEQINKAYGEANAMLAKAEAQSKSLRLVAMSLSKTKGKDAASLLVAEQYVKAFSKLAKTSNTLILPSNSNDVSSMVAQALTIYRNVSQNMDNNDTSDLNEEKDWHEYISDEEEIPKIRETTKDDTLIAEQTDQKDKEKTP